jgi:hypothetical protein
MIRMKTIFVSSMELTFHATKTYPTGAMNLLLKNIAHHGQPYSMSIIVSSRTIMCPYKT